jgi:hypothetical protein
MLEKYNKPIFFYSLSLIIPWEFWFAAAYISYLPGTSVLQVTLQGGLGILGLVSPAFVAAYLFLSGKELASICDKHE